MWRKIVLSVCFLLAATFCASFCIVEKNRTLDGPLFYHHYITYNVRTALRDQHTTRRMQEERKNAPETLHDPYEGLANTEYQTVEWIGLAAAVDFAHSFEVTSAMIDLNEHGVYKLMNTSISVDLDSYDLLRSSVSPTLRGPSGNPRFKTGITALYFDPNDLERLAETVREPIVVENLIVNYTYDGQGRTESVPIGKLVLYSADSNLERLSPNPVSDNLGLTGDGLGKNAAFSFVLQTLEGASIQSVSLACPKGLQAGFSVEVQQQNGRVRVHTSRSEDRWKEGLYYYQLDYIIQGTDSGGNPVTAVSDYQNYSFCMMSTDEKAVWAELGHQREEENE